MLFPGSGIQRLHTSQGGYFPQPSWLILHKSNSLLKLFIPQGYSLFQEITLNTLLLPFPRDTVTLKALLHERELAPCILHRETTEMNLGTLTVARANSWCSLLVNFQVGLGDPSCPRIYS